MGPPGGAPPPGMGPSPMPPMAIYDEVVISYEVKKPLDQRSTACRRKRCGSTAMRGRFMDSRIVGHERVVPVDELIAMGYDREELPRACAGAIGINEFTHGGAAYATLAGTCRRGSATA